MSLPDPPSLSLKAQGSKPPPHAEGRRIWTTGSDPGMSDKSDPRTDRGPDPRTDKRDQRTGKHDPRTDRRGHVRDNS